MDVAGLTKFFNILSDHIMMTELESLTIVITFKDWQHFDTDQKEIELTYVTDTIWYVSNHTFVYVEGVLPNKQSMIYCWDLGQIISVQVI